MPSLGHGTELGRYKIESELGAGGMSVVYRANDPKLQRTVAVKVMHDYLAQNKDAKTRFHREALAVAQLQHPNIIKILFFRFFLKKKEMRCLLSLYHEFSMFHQILKLQL